MNYELFGNTNNNKRNTGYKSTFRIYVKYDSEWFCRKYNITFSNEGMLIDGIIPTDDKMNDVWSNCRIYDYILSESGEQYIDYNKYSISEELISELLTDKYISPPYGIDLLQTQNHYDIPNSDHEEYQYDIEQGFKYNKLYQEQKRESIELVARLTYYNITLPEPLCLYAEFNYDKETRILLVTMDVPDFARIKITKATNKLGRVELSTTEKNKQCERLLYSLVIRAAYLVAKSDNAEMFETIVINAQQQWFDIASGRPNEGIIASLQSCKEDLLCLHLDHIDPKSCFRQLKGISTPSIERISVIRPIFTIDRNDSRIIKNKDVDESLTPDTNLAAMAWDDFEHLVRQLFEWEFGQNDVEVKVTQTSRDRGVDAIMFDPDPFRGGKYVFQAKRYTRTVDVSAVRDLYGTVVNEGANRGILITTSGFGPDSYEFAKDKPISLVDGPALIQLFKKHGRMYRINLEEARNQNNEHYNYNGKIYKE
jgi:hypothetical protein